jgi:putative spermidine/putrescine transport system permease protein
MLRLLLGDSRAASISLHVLCGLVLVFLVAPLLTILPLSVNEEAYFTFPIHQYSMRWYQALMVSPEWRLAAVNSLMVALGATILATVLGTLAALGLSRPGFPARTLVQGALTLPMVVPLVVIGASIYFLYSRIGLTGSFAGLILAHTTVAVPFVVITVTAALSSFDFTLVRAAYSCGASPIHTFRTVTLPLILPGVLSGMIFAFIASLDDVVIALFIANAPQWTLPRQMWSGLRENIDPTILAAATILTFISIAFQVTVEFLKRGKGRRA